MPNLTTDGKREQDRNERGSKYDYVAQHPSTTQRCDTATSRSPNDRKKGQIAGLPGLPIKGPVENS
jgi:hypothetical protein